MVAVLQRHYGIEHAGCANMAELLKRQYSIIVLKVELLADRADGEHVSFKVQLNKQGELVESQPKLVPANLICRASLRDSETSWNESSDFTLPKTMLEELRLWMDAETDYEQPLWVHLVSPYGLLRFVAWERVLGHAINRPILMLPDFVFPPPREAAATLDVVVCGSAPLNREDHSIKAGVAHAIQHIASVERDKVRIHVFVDKQIQKDLQSLLPPDLSQAGVVTFYDQERARPFVGDASTEPLTRKPGDLKSPWLLWIRECLRNQSVDVVHFVCHGYLARQRGALLFAQSPIERSRSYLSGPVFGADLQAFFTQIGAWSTVFSSIPDNSSEYGLRGLADEIAQARPGPLMMYVQKEDATGTALADGYRFLFSPHMPTAPASTALFIYCQPYLAALPVSMSRTRGAADDLSEFALKSVPRNKDQFEFATLSQRTASPLDRFFASPNLVTSTVAATERFAEQVELRYQQLTRDGVLVGEHGSRTVNTVVDTVSKLRAAVASLGSAVNEGPESL